jgi:hypothetical protein
MSRSVVRAAATLVAFAACGFAFAQEGAFPASPFGQQPPAIQLPQVQTPTITNNLPSLPSTLPPSTQPPRVPLVQPASPATPTPAPAPDAAAAAETNDFQDFIAHSVGQKLPLYGYNLFQRAPSTFAPEENIPVTPNYIIGPGD